MGQASNIPNEESTRVEFDQGNILSLVRAFRAPTGVNVHTSNAVARQTGRALTQWFWGYPMWPVGQVFSQRDRSEF